VGQRTTCVKINPVPKGNWYRMAKEDWLANCTGIRELKYDWTEENQEVGRLEEELDKDAICHRFYSTCTGRT